MLTTRDLIRIRYIIWKVRAWCWLVERLTARGGLRGRRDESEIQKKAPDRLREVRYAASSGPGVTSLGGNQARMNKQYSGHLSSWTTCTACASASGNITHSSDEMSLSAGRGRLRSLL
jgi:hypothetical protein